VNALPRIAQPSSVEIIFSNIHDAVVIARKATAAHVGRIARWPVTACALVALMASSAAFAKSPMVDDPRVTPYTGAALDHVTRAAIVIQPEIDRLDRLTRDLRFP
jgi:hypothetical protein